MKDSKGNPIYGGDIVLIVKGNLKGKKGYVYHFSDNEVRVTLYPRTGLMGWFEGKDLLVKTKRRSK